MNRTAVDRTEQDLKRLAEDWATSEQRGDTAFMQRTLTDDFIGIGPRGFILTKGEWLQRFVSGTLKYDAIDWSEVQVRVYGDAAVVTGRAKQKVRYQNQPMENDLRTTLVFVRPQEQWLLASLQFSPILGRP